MTEYSLTDTSSAKKKKRRQAANTETVATEGGINSSAGKTAKAITASGGNNSQTSTASGGAYDSLIRSLADKMADSSGFRYDVASDPLYRQYAEGYTESAKRAMEDTLADAASYTGGYENSYAVTAANGAYNNALSELNGIIPELYQLAYDAYRDDKSDAQSAFNAYYSLDERDYNRSRDAASDAKDERDFAYQQQQDALAQENFLKELYAKYPEANPDYTAPSASSGSSGNSSKGGTTADNCERFLKSLTSAQRQAVYTGTDAANTRYREEIIASVGQDGYEKLKKKYA